MSHTKTNRRPIPDPSSRSVVLLLTGYTAGRLSSGTVAFALLLAGRHHGGLAVGGLAVTGYTVAVAIVAPVLGRLLDRHGARLLLPGTAVGYAAGLAGTAAAMSGPAWAFVGLATVAGVFQPPFGPVVRAALTRGIKEDKRRSRLLSVENVSMEGLALLGPLIVTACAVVSPALALVLTAASALAGAITVVGVRWLPASSAASTRGSFVHLLRSRVGGLLLVVMTFTGGISALEVALVAYAGSGRQTLSGVLLALLSAGSIASGIITGIWALPGNSTRRFAASLAWFTVGSLALLLPVGTGLFIGLVVLVSLAMTPAFAAMTGAFGELADDAHVSETFAWMGSANLVGIAAWTGGAGWLAQHSGANSVMVLTGASFAASFLLILAVAAAPADQAADQAAGTDAADATDTLLVLPAPETAPTPAAAVA